MESAKTIQDCISLYEQASTIIGSLEKRKSELEQLEHKLGITLSRIRAACSEAGFSQLVKHTLQNREGEVELIQLTVKRHGDAIQRNSSKAVVQKNYNYNYFAEFGVV